MGFVNALHEVCMSIMHLSSASGTELKSDLWALQPIQQEDSISSSAPLQMSLPEPQLDNSQTDCIVPSVNDDGWRHQKARQQHQWLVVKFGIYIVSIFFSAMSWHLHHPYSQHLFNVITSINSTSVVNAFHLYTESHIQWSAPPCDNIHLLRMLQSSEFTGFFQTCGISISHLQALVLVPDTRSLYTQETCSKFHNLLCGLLRGYSDALSSLMVQWGSMTLSAVISMGEL